MKTKIIRITLLLLTATTFISLTFFKSSDGPHGGIVKQAGEYTIEIKNSHPYFYAYLLDKKNKPISNKGISCETKFIFPDSTSINVVLKPFGNDGFSMETGSLKFYSCRIYFTVFGQSVSASFENENPIVQKK